MTKKKAKYDLKTLMVLVLAILGLALAVIVVQQQTVIGSYAKGVKCSPKSDKKCKGKYEGKTYGKGSFTCEDSGDEDNKGRPICEKENIKGGGGGKFKAGKGSTSTPTPTPTKNKAQ